MVRRSSRFSSLALLRASRVTNSRAPRLASLDGVGCVRCNRWLQAPVAATDLIAAYRANALFDAHRDDPEFGYRYLVEEAADAGQVMAQRSAWAICSRQGWWSAFGKPKRGKKSRKAGPLVHEDYCAVVDQHGVTRHVFTADAPVVAG